MRKLTTVLVALVVLAGCRFPTLTPHTVATRDAVSMAATADDVVPSMHGQVTFAERSTQATFAEIGTAASVAVIHTGTNQAVASTLTNPDGSFVMTFPGSFRPAPLQTYYLEAVKGLDNNNPGGSVARVRTVITFDQGWKSLTSAQPNASVTVNPGTTALAIGAALKNGNPTAFDLMTLIGSLTPGSSGVYTPVSGLSNADFLELVALVRQSVSTDQDPVAGVGYVASSGAWVSVNQTLSIAGFTPASAPIGATVTVVGSGFSTTPSNNVIRFNGQPATVTAATATSLTTTVPAGATSGPTTLQSGNLTLAGPIFTVPVVISGMSPASGSAGVSVTLTGSGFDTSALNKNAVTFGGAAATVTAVTNSSLTATVPTAAESGPVRVIVSGSTGTSSGVFTIPLVFTGFSPYIAPIGTSITLLGSGFSATPANNLVKFNGVTAVVTSASVNILRVTSPTSTTGPISITVGAQNVTGPSFTYGSILQGPGLISTFVGTRTPQSGTLATNWGLQPGNMAVDAAGNRYVADTGHQVILKITPSGILSTFAGNGFNGFSGDGGPATSAQMSSPQGMAIDASGNVYFGDANNYRIRKVNTAGIISTLAGTGTNGSTGDGGPAVNATISSPRGLAIDVAGNLYFSDNSNNRIRKIDPSGIISTVAGNGAYGSSGDGGPAINAALANPAGLAVDATGSLYIADSNNYRIRKVDTAGIISTFAGTGTSGNSGDGGLATDALLNYPWDLAVDKNGGVYIADQFNHRIRKVTAGGLISTVAGNGTYGFSGDGGPATLAQINSPMGVTVDDSGNLYVADTSNYVIRKVDTSGVISTIAGTMRPNYAGDGGSATAAQIAGASSMAMDAAGSLYLADSNNYRIRKVTAGGLISTVAGNGTSGFSGDGGPATSAQIGVPRGVAVDSGGNLYISDGSRIRKVDTSGVISTFAGTGTGGFSGDGGPATSAQIYTAFGLAVDASGSLYIADGSNFRIRKVDASGVITTIAGSGTSGYSGDNGPATSATIFAPRNLAVDSVGNLYFAMAQGYRIRKVNTSGVISTVAGTGTSGFSGDSGPADLANIAVTGTLINASGLAVDAVGNLYFADTINRRIRKVDAWGIITTLAGTGVSGFSGDGGAASTALMGTPTGVAVGPLGDVYFCDNTYFRVRRVF